MDVLLPGMWGAVSAIHTDTRDQSHFMNGATDGADVPLYACMASCYVALEGGQLVLHSVYRQDHLGH